MAETPIKFGILGCANIARKVSRAISLSPNAVLYAIGSRSVEKAERFAAANNFPAAAKIYGSYDAVLDDPDVDAVYVPLPTSLHLKWAVLAAEKKKHVLLEKPVALNTAELDAILSVCETAGVQFMDSTMWMHHPRTALMRDFLSDPHRFGQLRSVHSCFTFAANPSFLESNIRVNPDLDSLGALGDIGWYCIRAILLAANFKLPTSVVALRSPILNSSGVILSCSASLYWEESNIVATFHCSFLSNLIMDITAMGTNGTLHLHDFAIPFDEEEASFTIASKSSFDELDTSWVPKPTQHIAKTELPQEALMVKEFSRLVAGIKRGLSPEKKWPELSRKTQLVLDAVKKSIDGGCESVEIAS